MAWRILASRSSEILQRDDEGKRRRWRRLTSERGRFVAAHGRDPRSAQHRRGTAPRGVVHVQACSALGCDFGEGARGVDGKRRTRRARAVSEDGRRVQMARPFGVALDRPEGEGQPPRPGHGRSPDPTRFGRRVRDSSRAGCDAGLRRSSSQTDNAKLGGRKGNMDQFKPGVDSAIMISPISPASSCSSSRTTTGSRL